MPPEESRSSAWESLPHADDDALWDQFYARFAFRPTVHPEGFPSIREPVPSLTFGLPREPGSSIRDGVNGRLGISEEDIADLHASMLAAFRACTGPKDRIAVLDWQHQAYWLFPHRLFDHWPISVWPDGDYYLFLAPDLSWGTFAHPWEWTICVFGQPLLDAVIARPPRLFRDLIRRDGMAFPPPSRTGEGVGG